MSDLLERLREACEQWGELKDYENSFLTREAADRIEAQAKRIAELEAALHDAAELAFERRDEAAKAAKRIAELEAALQDAYEHLTKHPSGAKGWNALLNKLEATLKPSP